MLSGVTAASAWRGSTAPVTLSWSKRSPRISGCGSVRRCWTSSTPLTTRLASRPAPGPPRPRAAGPHGPTRHSAGQGAMSEFHANDDWDEDEEAAPLPLWKRRKWLLIGVGVVVLLAFVFTRGKPQHAQDAQK